MRKLLVLLSFVPLIAAIGHDVHNYYQNPEKGFHFADVGWILAKYDPETHNQINQELTTLIEQGEASKTPVITAEPVQSPQNLEETQNSEPAPEQTNDASQDNDENTIIKVTVQKNASSIPGKTEIIGNAAGIAAFLMQQKAVAVAGGFALIVLILSRLCSGIKLSGGKKEMDEIDLLGSKKKGGTYKYGRK